MSGDQPMRCPECGEDAVGAPPVDLVPWDTLGISTPEWSHRDGSSLCLGPSGYQPAQPQPADAESASPRLEPPAGLRQPAWVQSIQQAALRNDDARPSGIGGPIGREYMSRTIARLGDQHMNAQAEPEAGA